LVLAPEQYSAAARPLHQGLKAFVDQYRGAFGVEPICKLLRIAPSGYRRHAAQLRDPPRRCARTIGGAVRFCQACAYFMLSRNT
jgi:hypothetical protein